MKQYKLPVTLYQPSQETDNKYMAEIPILPGCRAWGETPAEALDNLESVASEFILSHKKHGHPLPKAVEASAYELVGAKVATGVTIPNWGSKDLSAGTVSKILRDLGIQKEELDKA